jgi:hypothetical protein
MQDTWEGSPLVSLKGAVSGSHVFRPLLVPGPHFPEDARDTTRRAACQWQRGLCPLGKGWILFSHLLEVSGSKEKPGVGEACAHFDEPDLIFVLEKRDLHRKTTWETHTGKSPEGKDVALDTVIQGISCPVPDLSSGVLQNL